MVHLSGEKKNLLLVINSQVLVTPISSIWSNLSRFKQFGKINILISHKTHFVLQICFHNVCQCWYRLNKIPLKNTIVDFHWFEVDNYHQVYTYVTSLIEGLSCFLERLWGLKMRTCQKTFLNLRVLSIPCKARGKLPCKHQIAHLFSVTRDSVVSSNSVILSECSGDVTESFPSQFVGYLLLHSSCDIFCLWFTVFFFLITFHFNELLINF